MLEILRRESVRCGADIQLKHPSSGVNVWERNVNTFLESEHQRLGRRRETIGRVRRRSRRPVCVEEEGGQVFARMSKIIKR
jgi:hypothetical protein